jgi:hypothetical protein
MDETESLMLRLYNKQSQNCGVVCHGLRLAEFVVVAQVLSSNVPVLLSERDVRSLQYLPNGKSIAISLPEVHSFSTYQLFEFSNRRSDEYCHIILFVVSLATQKRFNGYFQSRWKRVSLGGGYHSLLFTSMV